MWWKGTRTTEERRGGCLYRPGLTIADTVGGLASLFAMGMRGTNCEGLGGPVIMTSKAR